MELKKGLRHYAAENSSKWFPDVENEGTVRLERSNGEIIVQPESVKTNKKVKIIEDNSSVNIKKHAVKVRKVEEIEDYDSEYGYTAAIIDDDLQQDTESQGDKSRKMKEQSNPFKKRQAEAMSPINGRHN